jgi:predicted Zn-dependent protease
MKRIALILNLIIMPLSYCYGFELLTSSGAASPPFVQWDISKGPVAITLNSAGSNDVPFRNVEGAVQQALDKWQSISSQNLRFQYAGRSTAAQANSSDNINSIVWIEKHWEYSGSTLAITKSSYYIGDPSYLVDTDILMNGVDFHWSTDADSNGATVDVQQILMHELGHASGLAHSSRYKAVMYPYLRSQVRHLLTSDDKAAIRFLYGAPAEQFSNITPLPRAIYVANMSKEGLPLPVFRWTAGSHTNFILQFSGASDFKHPFSIRTNNENFYALHEADENKLNRLAVKNKLWWRVVSESETTKASCFRLKTVY